jgi:glycyl-tRNA synthetase beta chain
MAREPRREPGGVAVAELLLELLSEEIPARMQARAADDLKRLVTAKLKEAGLSFDKAEAYVTPRRLALVVDGLPLKQPDITEGKKGPRVGASEQAIQGFLKANGLSSLDQCEKRKVGKADFWFAVVERNGGLTSVVVGDTLPLRILNFPWPKSMRWGRHDFRWVRPLRNVLAVFDGQPVNFSFELSSVQRPKSGEIEFNNKTFGHRFLAPEPFTVKDFADYKAKLKKAKVILDPAERREVIWKEARKLAKAEGLTVKQDDALLAEVAGMVEWPKVYMGGIDEAFMDLPAEVLTTVMRHNQKYFSLLNKDGSLAPRFIVVADAEPKDEGEAIVAGNERVLRARLADAKFFWDQDRKRTLESRVAALGDIVFHAKLGSLGEKAKRIEKLAAEIAACLPGVDEDAVREAARLAKTDLTTEMVGEFPELQGVIGRYYALEEGKPGEIADAIAEHYAPQGPDDICPTAPISVAVALADKIDTLVNLFAIDEKPTGSKDPFALRRGALGAIRLIVENNLRLPLRTLLSSGYEKYEEQARRREFSKAAHRKPEEGQHLVFEPPEQPGDLDRRSTKLSSELLAFFADRLKVHLREKGVRHDLISAVFALTGEDDLVRLLARVEALGAFLASDDGEHLLTAYKRAANIVRIEEKRDGKPYNEAPVADLIRQDEEKELHASLAAAAKASSDLLADEDFAGAMAELAKLRGPVDRFFDEVTVNCEEPRLRANRLRLLSEIRSTLDRVADFSKIEGVGGA